ncbi:MAG: CBS domain-containing protein [Erysipelotrichaceae bacterium]|nr:CBS domain-containing protein [Erysipelotrichaceae bacterium]
MKKVNLLLLITPKTELACLNTSMNVRQALEKMRAHGYSAIPMINNEGEYMGTVAEGDLLWQIVQGEKVSMEGLEKIQLTELPRKDDMPAVKVDAPTEELVAQITNHNFIPVVDDRNVLMGIVTRRKVIQELIEK